MNSALKPPSRWASLAELRAGLDLLHMLPTLARSPVVPTPNGKSCGKPVVVLPGFGADDRAMWPMRRYLQSQGYAAEGWGLGLNDAGLNRPHTLADLSPPWGNPQKQPYHGEAGVPYLCGLMTARIRQRAESLQRPISLVGWSLGGFIAREVARDLPDMVDKVITLGSPVIGGPKYTAAAPLFRAQGQDLDWIEQQIAAREVRPIQCPIVNIFSRYDGVVSVSAAQDHCSPNVQTIEVTTAHLGLAFSPAIWRRVVVALGGSHQD